MSDTPLSLRKGLIALSPLVVFIALYLGTSLATGDFYRIPITVAFLLSSIYAVIVCGGNLEERIKTYSRGASSDNLMLMLWIFVLAGAFANCAKAMGSVEATVNLTLSVLPPSMLMAGMFIAACFISISIGTSVGTVAALVPIAAATAQQTGISTPMMTAIIVGGSFFGDNLSFISDTTIVATASQGCRMKDKFRVNFFIVLPAVIILIIAYLIMGADMTWNYQAGPISLLKMIPYIVVLVTAAFGLNVMKVLPIGLLLAGVIGLLDGSFDVFGWMKAMSEGILGMSELIIITMMAGGLLAIIKQNGGIDFIIGRLTRHVRSKRSAELTIASLVSIVNVCTANNTVAILTVGDIARQISKRFQLDARKVASILDTFSCMTQGLLPYGAQILIAAGLAGLNPVEIVPYLYYPLLLGLSALVAILLRLPRRYSR